METTWNVVKDAIRAKIGQTQFDAWFKDLKFICVKSDVLHLCAATEFEVEGIMMRYSTMILAEFNNAQKESVVRSIEVNVQQNDFESEQHITQHATNDAHSEMREISRLDERFRFENFVVGKPNEFAYAAAKRVAESDVPSFNPLFLYGGVGLGKTHLMHAIAWKIKEIYPHKRVVYLSAEKFMYLFIRSLRDKTAVSFKELFRNTDVLMVDDVQFIGGKDATQEEFFHTFNELIENNRQIVLSADKSPSELDRIEERMKSRMGWGLVADIHPTTYELRYGILQNKVKNYTINIPREVLEFLAVKITSNIRELEGGLNRIVAHASLVGVPVSVELAQDVLKDLLRANEKVVTIDMIQQKVCEHYRIKVSDILSAKRTKEITKARHVAMLLCKELTTKSLPEIGRMFGGKDHATVIHAVRKIQEKMQCDRELENDVEKLKRVLEV